MYKLDFEKIEEPEIKLTISIGSQKKQENSRKTSISDSLTMLQPLTVGHNKLWKILKKMRIPDHLTCILRNLNAGQDATVRTKHGTTDQFKMGKEYVKPLYCSESESLSIVFDSATPWTIKSMEFSRPEYWSGQPFPSPGDLPNPRIKPWSPALQADSLLAEPSGKSKNTGVGSLSLLQQIFLIQESNQGLLHCRWTLYQLSYQGSPFGEFQMLKAGLGNPVNLNETRLRQA